MYMTVAGVSFWIACNVLYYVGGLTLLVKNGRRTDTRFIGVCALLIGPWLILLPAAQLLFVVPLYTVFIIHGLTVPKFLPPRTIFAAAAMTLLILGIMAGVLLCVYGL